MTKRISAKHKIDRRLGENLWGRPKSPINKREYGPGQHGQRRKGKISDFGTQLKAKQKLKGYYGNHHREAVPPYLCGGDAPQGRYFREPDRASGTASRCRRLPRKFVPTPFAARQFVNHGHMRVNGRRVTIPSYRCRQGDVIEVGQKARQLVVVLEAMQSPERDVPDYIDVDTGKMTATLARVPQLADVPYPVLMEPKYRRRVLFPLKRDPVTPALDPIRGEAGFGGSCPANSGRDADFTGNHRA